MKGVAQSPASERQLQIHFRSCRPVKSAYPFVAIESPKVIPIQRQ